MEHAGGLAGAVAVEEGVLLLGADPAGELAADVGLEVEHGVVQELVGHLDEGAELVGADGDLAEGVVGLGDEPLLVDPGRGALAGHDRDLAVAGLGVDDVGELAEDVLLLERLDEGLLELVGDEVAALGVGADLERVHDGRRGGLGLHRVPERLGVGAGALPLLGFVVGVGEDGGGDGLGELGLDGLHALQALDLVGEGVELLLHAGVLLVVLGGEHALFGAVGV